MLIKERLKQQDGFTDIDCAIADFFLAEGETVRSLSVRQIAEQLYVAPSSVMRFCRRMGYPGFQDFKKAYLEELRYLTSHFRTIDPNFPFGKMDTQMTVANKIAALYDEIVKDCLSLLTVDQISQAAEILKHAKAIYICTSGAQLGLSEVFRDKMMKIGRLVEICHHTDEAYYHACYCDPESCFLLISYSGETDRVLRVGQKLKERGIRRIAVTSFGENSLSRESDLCLFVSTREKLTQNLGSFGISVSVMYLLDMLYANYFNFEFDQHYQQKIMNTKAYEKGVESTRRYSDNPVLED